MKNLTPNEVQEQKERFDSLMTKINLPKIGKALVAFTVNAKDTFNSYNYISKVLAMHKISRSMYYPGTQYENKFYGEILNYKALEAYIGTFQVK